MITPQEIENFARQIAEPDFPISHASLDPLIGHLNTADFRAVLDRAAKIAREMGKAADAEADALENMERLARATGMQDGGNPVTWLQERGLIEEVDGGLRFKKAKPEEAGSMTTITPRQGNQKGNGMTTERDTKQKEFLTATEAFQAEYEALGSNKAANPAKYEAVLLKYIRVAVAYAQAIESTPTSPGALIDHPDDTHAELHERMKTWGGDRVAVGSIDELEKILRDDDEAKREAEGR